MTLVPFKDLLARPDVVALAERTFDDPASPEWLGRFMALTMACSPLNPEEDLLDSYATSGVCVFYARGLDGEGKEEGGYEPWTCQLHLGASLSFWFCMASGDCPVIPVDDGWLMPDDGSRPGREALGWPPELHALLERSLWGVVRDPAGLQLG